METLKAALRYLPKTALITEHRAYTFQELLHGAFGISQTIKSLLYSPSPLGSATSNFKWGLRVGLLLPSGPEYVSATWGTWLAGGIIVPLATSHTTREIDHVINDAQIPLVLTSEILKDYLSVESRELAHVYNSSDFTTSSDILPSLRHIEGINEESGALIIYTSGTTGRPKGVLHTHKSLKAQISSLSAAWQWSPDDTILHALPLHHIHGIVNALYCAHANGACVIAEKSFSPRSIWNQLQTGRISIFMAVPTMYSHLITHFEQMEENEEKQRKRAAASQVRLYVSGSSACPISILRKWEDITGCMLLERYGMTEIGMALSNPYHGERRGGFVGEPLPGITVKINPDPNDTTMQSGELLVKGDSVFKEYWNRPEATAEAFDTDGFFKTGDTISVGGSPAYFKILGRTSVGIIKSGGFKLSALGVENTILEHNSVKECCVIGVPDEVYGETVVALVVGGGREIGEVELKEFCRSKLAKYKIPKVFKFVKEIPKNAMCKINKKEILNKYLNCEF